MAFGCACHAHHVPGQPTEYQACRRDLDQRLARLHCALVVLGESVVPNHSGKASLHDPEAWLDTAAAHGRSTLHDLEVPAAALLLALTALLD